MSELSNEQAREENAAAAWDFIKSKLVEMNRERGAAGVWSNGYRSGWDAAIRHAQSRVSVGAVKECCVPDDGEPSFVLLGRDPQAPALVEEWAVTREKMELGTKPAQARVIAAKMREYKTAHPSKGASVESYLSALTPASAEGEADREALIVRVGNMIIAAANIPEQEAYHLAREIVGATTRPSTPTEGMVKRMARSHYDQRMGRVGAFDDAPRGTQTMEITFALAALLAAQESGDA